MTHASVPERATGDDVRVLYAGLVRDAATGDRGAMERLLMRAQEVAYRFSLLVCGHAEDAEDVMQDALLKTYQHVTRIEDPNAFRTWLYTTVRNLCLVKRRRRVGEPTHHVSLDAGPDGGDGRSPMEVADQGKAADERLVDQWVGSRLRRALAALPPALRALVVMREVEGLSTREVATIMGLSEDNVKQRLHRARVRMRRQLEVV